MKNVLIAFVTLGIVDAFAPPAQATYDDQHHEAHHHYHYHQGHAEDHGHVTLEQIQGASSKG